MHRYVVLTVGLLVVACGDGGSPKPRPTATVTTTATTTPNESATTTSPPTTTPTPTKTCYTPATPIPERTCDPSQCHFTRCALSGQEGTCTVREGLGDCYCFVEGPTFTVTPMSCATPTPTRDECENQCSGPGERSCSSSRCGDFHTAAGGCRPGGDNRCHCGPFECASCNVRPDDIPEDVDGLSVTVSGISDFVGEIEVRGGTTTVFAEFTPNPPRSTNASRRLFLLAVARTA
jgi:hypothetical protein